MRIFWWLFQRDRERAHNLQCDVGALPQEASSRASEILREVVDSGNVDYMLCILTCKPTDVDL